ncbi:MAG: protein kinase [Planctomycetota bacterium]|nr:protein kinase [Planctomycetota bacterium]
MAAYSTSKHGHFNHPDYEFLGEISRGGMGVIYRAHHKLLKVDRAFKLILTDKADLTLMERFEREARTLAKLNHPHILKVHAYGHLNGSPYLVTDLIDGSDLESHLKSNALRLDVDWLSDRLIELASALEYCHEQGIAHRDLKPANVIIRRDTNQAILIDFGLVKKDQVDSASLEPLSKTGELIGTPEYMAPEQFDNSGQYGKPGPKSDTWSFGVLLYYSLTGRKPFQGSSIYHFFKSVLQTQPDSIQSLNEEAPAKLVALAMDCLQRDGQKRPTMTEVRERLESLDEPENKAGELLAVFLKSVFALLLIVAISVTIYEMQDRTPPEFKLNVPTKGLYKDRISVSGFVFEDDCTVTLNGEVMTLVDRQFQFDWPLSENMTTYHVEVMDSSGNSAVLASKLKRIREVRVGASEESEFATITEALETVPEDVVIKVEEGSYEGGLVLQSDHRIEAANLAKKVIILTKDGHCVLVKGGEPWLRGLSLEVNDHRDGDKFHAIVVEKGTLTLNGCVLRSKRGHGILVTGRNARLMANGCEINRSGAIGVYVEKHAIADLESCKISENVMFNVRCESAELRLKDCGLNDSKIKMGLFAGAKSTVYANGCVLKNNSSQGARVTYGAKLYMEDCEILNTKPAPIYAKGLAPYEGTGVYGHGQALISLKSCKVSGNAGKGVWGNNKKNKIVLSNCEIARNKKSGVEVSGKGHKLEIKDCKLYENGVQGLRSNGNHKISMTLVKSWKNGRSGFYIKNGGHVESRDSHAFQNKEGGFVLFIKSTGVFTNCQSSENTISGFMAIENSKLEGLNCQSIKNERGLYGKGSQTKWVGGVIRENRVGGFLGKEKSKSLLENIKMSGNKNYDIKVELESTVELKGFAGRRGRLNVKHDKSSKILED